MRGAAPGDYFSIGTQSARAAMVRGRDNVEFCKNYKFRVKVSQERATEGKKV